MTNWSMDPQVWDKIDDLLLGTDVNLRNFLDSMFEYKQDIPQIFQVLLFSCLGKFVVAYSECRRINPETEIPFHDPPMSFHIALQSVAEDPAAQQLMQGGINQMVDNKIGGMF